MPLQFGHGSLVASPDFEGDFLFGPGRPGRLSALRVSHSESVLHVAFVWVRMALSNPKWRFPARAVVGVEGSCKVPQASCNIDINFPELFLDGARVASGMQINNVMGVTIGPGGYFLNFTEYGLQVGDLPGSHAQRFRSAAARPPQGKSTARRSTAATRS